jgi:CRP-like cAMP-binding protein
VFPLNLDSRFLANSDGVSKGGLHLITITKISPRLRDSDGFRDGSGPQEIQNAILRDIPKKERDSVLAKAQFVELPNHTVLNEISQPIKFAYFIDDGLASILNVMADGKMVEVGLAGKEGFIGLPLLVDFESSPTQVVMQVKGSGYRISAEDFKDVLRNSPRLNRILQRFSQVLGMQATQIAACNRLHGVEERLARWLLMSQDRLGGDIVPLTQEFLAHMLGTRRASVTDAAGALQKRGLIAYRRGNVKINDRHRLEEVSCECYQVMVRQSYRWDQEADSRSSPK